ncbi:hypothetical protein LJR267_002936 [Paraburkholderia hospita]|uniref:hypothetical protein n=1 Tax=Paraburkholderia hospita TaxID=169430 RepID=UPI003ECDAC64
MICIFPTLMRPTRSAGGTAAYVRKLTPAAIKTAQWLRPQLDEPLTGGVTDLGPLRRAATTRAGMNETHFLFPDEGQHACLLAAKEFKTWAVDVTAGQAADPGAFKCR